MNKTLAAALACGLLLCCGSAFSTAEASSQDFVRKAVVNEAKREAKSEVKDKASDTLPSLAKPSISAKEARKLAVKYNHTGYKALPASIANTLGRGKPLPPGIGKKEAPADMLAELPQYSGYTWTTAGQDLVLCKTGTGDIIAEVLHGVFK